MNLSEYMQVEGLNDLDMAAKLSKSRVTVNRYKRGVETIPSEVVKQLVEISSGRMTANELLGIRAKAAT